MSDKPGIIQKDKNLSWFENKNNFVYYHESKANDIFREKFKLD